MAKLPRPLVSSHSRRAPAARSATSSCATVSDGTGGSGGGDLPNIGRAYYGQPPVPDRRCSAAASVPLQPSGLATVRSSCALLAKPLVPKCTVSCVAEATATL